MSTVRKALLSDLAAVREIFRTASLGNTGDRDALLAHPEVLVFEDTAIVEGRTRVAVDDDGQVVGFATPRPLGERVWELDDLFVAPRHMRRGFATKLIEDLVGGAAEQGVDHIQVTANPHAMQFYRSVGFVDEGVAETQFGPAPLLRLDIPRF
jgi:GNAT superfamily N-acetyltransferase